MSVSILILMITNDDYHSNNCTLHSILRTQIPDGPRH